MLKHTVFFLKKLQLIFYNLQDIHIHLFFSCFCRSLHFYVESREFKYLYKQAILFKDYILMKYNSNYK